MDAFDAWVADTIHCGMHEAYQGRPRADVGFRLFMARTLEHAMTTRRTPSFRERALYLSKTLGLTRTCAMLEGNL